jgi:hypothetical protein
VSEIKFVNRLGDAIERSAAAHVAGRRGRLRRRLLGGALGIAIAAAGAAAASGVFSDPQTLAATPVSCYDARSLARNVAVVSAGEATPIETCRRVLGIDGPLVACAEPTVTVHVFPGRAGTCRKLGLEPMPRDYAAARQRVNAFARDVMALERRSGCLPPAEFARHVQALLERSGWTGWRPWVRLDVQDGPCGAVSGVDGAGRRTIDGALSTDKRRVIVVGTARP